MAVSIINVDCTLLPILIIQGTLFWLSFLVIARMKLSRHWGWFMSTAETQGRQMWGLNVKSCFFKSQIIGNTSLYIFTLYWLLQLHNVMRLPYL